MSQQMICANRMLDYCRLLYQTLLTKTNINCIRLQSMIAPMAMIEAADETGMLIIDQSGVWSSASNHYRNAGEPLLDSLRKEFTVWVAKIR